ncbi:glutathione S-transferase N-terminal domain-containing protein [Mangrovibrevibacter kandeliae]|uniref:glutathione S-transferase N-terminal domain-containing protein n=1 Tax=Mangrovibrevibacter kandeliae TaxID=2968473 RepID=UPI0021184784|nr:glutathione S-transferase N-terminal domain-containing protein [Aurantimonas sp. CSK15Z-1]MCQ8784214.1 glutathione S-transferase N-terminal domain-containing protein [Aurantimonas sp. CSK15Z-1]
MIELYTWTTPNGQKPMIMLEETGLTYHLNLVNIGAGEQQRPDFLAISPNGKIPAIVDRDADLPVFESGAILLYLAEKSGKFLPASGAARVETLEWMFFQAAHTGPMIGQYHHFATAAPEKIPYAIERYRKESLRVLGVLDQRLKSVDYIAGEYSVADMMHFGWARSGLSNFKGEGAENLTALAAWVERVEARPAVSRALDKLNAAKEARG